MENVTLSQSSTFLDGMIQRLFLRGRGSPLDDPCKNKFVAHPPRGTKVVIYHLVGNFMLNSMHNVVSLSTCAESL